MYYLIVKSLEIKTIVLVRNTDEQVEKTSSFFKIMVESGRIFIWCNEAPAYETISKERWSKKFYEQRSLRIGGLVGEKIRQRAQISQRSYSLIKSVVWIAAMTIITPFAKIVGDHLYLRAVTKIMYNKGLLLGFMGRAVIRNRDE
jgi:hypothetical protein